MIRILEDLVKHDPSYLQSLLTCIVASEIVSNEDPISLINSKYKSYNHGIRKLVKSKIDVNYMICDCSNKQNKILLLSFGVTESMQDFLLNSQLDRINFDFKVTNFYYCNLTKPK